MDDSPPLFASQPYPEVAAGVFIAATQARADELARWLSEMLTAPPLKRSST